MQVCVANTLIVQTLTQFIKALLIYRLHRYRREFTTLCSARSTTKSRFVRLFLICIAIIVVYLPWTIYLLVKTSLQSHDPYDWDRVHDPRIFNSIIRIPAYGQVSIGKWVQVATGYWMFFIFGTGSDARNQYKQMLIGIGLGKLFPSLHNMHHTGNSTPSSFGAAKSWTLDLPSKAKKLFLSRRGSVIEMTSMSRSTVDDRSTSPSEVHHLRTISTEEPILQKPITAKEALTGNNRPLFLQRVFRPSAAQLSTLLPIFALSKRTASPTSDTQDSACRVASRGVSTHAWAVDREDSERISEADGVHVVKEVH